MGEPDNPFNPGAGRRPPLLTGRDRLIASMHLDMGRVVSKREEGRPCVIWGLRGIGKTVLLNELAEHARNSGWIVILTEATERESLSQRIAQATYLELRQIRTRSKRITDTLARAVRVLRSFQLTIDPSGSYSIGIDVEPARGYADTGNLSLDLQDMLRALGDAAHASGTAVFLGIDELQEAGQKELDALNVALHTLGQGNEQTPLFFCGTGLPTLPSILAKATSYAERMYRYHQLDLLSNEDVRLALQEPCERLGVSWDEGAIQRVTAVSAGYPYFVQSCGYFAWEQRTSSTLISDEDAMIATRLAQDEVDSGLYRSRWDRATDAQRRFMEAMSLDEGASLMDDLAWRLGRKPSSLTSVRKRLVDAGLIYAPRTGQLDFTVPGMGRYIQRVSSGR